MNIECINLRKEASNLSFFDEYRLQSELKRQYNIEHFNSKSKYKYENKLLHLLFKNYNQNILPRENNNESLKLNIGLAMIQLVNIVRFFFSSINFIRIDI